MNLFFKIGQWGVETKDRLPKGFRESLVNGFFRHVPVWVIRIIWKEMEGYFKFATPRPGDIVMDAGAWTGHFTIVASRLVGPTGRVISIEPQKAMAELLRSRLDHLGIKNVTVVNTALFNRADKMVVHKNPTSGFNVFDKPAGKDDTETVSLRTIDEILATMDIKSLNFIKMDIEGAEIEALEGAGATLSNMKPLVAIATYHVREGANTSARTEEILKRHNYWAQTGHPMHLTTWGRFDGTAKA